MRTTAEEMRRVLYPAELAEGERRAKPSAAVIVLLRQREGGLEVLLGRRADREGDPWSGQIALPGGQHHEGEGGLLDTALREAREEMGLDLRGNAEVLGHLAPRAPGNVPELVVVPFVALASGDLEPRPGPEMAETFWVPLADLPRARKQVTVSSSVGELNVPAYVHGGRVIWGLTYRVLEELLVLLGAE